MNEHTTTGALAAALSSLASNDELQSLLVALFALAVREAIYWWRTRRRTELSP